MLKEGREEEDEEETEDAILRFNASKVLTFQASHATTLSRSQSLLHLRRMMILAEGEQERGQGGDKDGAKDQSCQ